MINHTHVATSASSPLIVTPHSIECFHQTIHSAIHADTPITLQASLLLDIRPKQKLEREQWALLKSQFTASLALDLAREQAELVNKRICSRLETPHPPETYEDLFLRVEALYRELVKPWSPLLMLFMHSVFNNCRQRGVEELLFLARDGNPLFVICQRLCAQGHSQARVTLMEVNRAMVRAAAKNDFSQHTKESFLKDLSISDWDQTTLYTYLSSSFSSKGRIAFVETGVYGTLIKLMLEMRILDNPLVFFLASRNPNIFGYLNFLSAGLVNGSKVPYEFANLCCDTVETWPKLYSTSELVEFDGEIRVTATLMDPISVCANLSICRALAQACDTADISALDPRDELLSLYELSRTHNHEDSSLPIVLPRPVPRWKHAGYWCKSWDLGPLAPMDQIIGPASDSV